MPYFVSLGGLLYCGAVKEYLVTFNWTNTYIKIDLRTSKELLSLVSVLLLPLEIFIAFIYCLNRVEGIFFIYTCGILNVLIGNGSTQGLAIV